MTGEEDDQQRNKRKAEGVGLVLWDCEGGSVRGFYGVGERERGEETRERKCGAWNSGTGLGF